MATLQHSSWRIPWAEEPGGLQPWGRTESDVTEAAQNTRGHLNRVLRGGQGRGDDCRCHEAGEE